MADLGDGGYRGSRSTGTLPVNAEPRQVVAQRLNTLVGLLVQRFHVQGAVEMFTEILMFRMPAVPRVDSGKGQNRTLRPLSALWPPVFAGEKDVGPPNG